MTSLSFEGIVALFFEIHRMGTGFGRFDHDLRVVAHVGGSLARTHRMHLFLRADLLRWQRHRVLVLHGL